MEIKKTANYFAEKNDKYLSREKSDFLYRGDRDEIFTSLIKEIAPFGKIAGVFSEKSYAENFKNISALLSAVNVSLFSVVVFDGEDEIEVAKTFTALPEDVRACVVFDRKKIRLAKYLASLRGLPLVIYATDPDITGSFAKNGFIRNGKSIDTVTFNNANYLIYDFDKLENKNFAGVYGRLISYLFSLTDYRIFSAVLKISPNAEAFSQVKESALFAARLKGTDFEGNDGKEFKRALAEAIIAAETGDACSENRISFCSATRFAAALYCDDGDGNVEMLMASRIAVLYREYFAASCDSLLKITDYFARAKNTAELLKTDGFRQSENLVKQVETFNKSRVSPAKIKEKLKEEALSLSRYFDAFLKTFKSLKGNNLFNEKRTIKCVRHSGDGAAFNCVSLMREQGFCEFGD